MDEVICPPEPTNIPLILTAPLVNKPNSELQNSSAEVPILLGLPESPSEPRGITSQPQASSEAVQPSYSNDNITSNTSRPRREPRRQKHLCDYIT